MLETFFAACGDSSLGELSSVAVEKALKRCFQVGAAAWPDFELGAVDFAGYLGKRVDSRQLLALSEEQAAEFFLLAACNADIGAAVKVVHDRYFDEVPVALSRFGLPNQTVEDIQQSLRAKFLIQGDREALLHDYVGGGSLRGLIRVAAIRTAISLARKVQRELLESTPEIRALEASQASPELTLLKSQYHDHFKHAFEVAVGLLTVRERTLLRFHAVDEIRLEQLATMYRVHRSTVARWLSSARQKLGEQTLQELSRRLSIPREELDSAVHLIRSQLDLSLSRLLKKDQ